MMFRKIKCWANIDQEEIFAYVNFNQSHEYLEVFLDRNPGKNT